MNNNLNINPIFSQFVNEQLLPETGVDPSLFWQTLCSVMDTFSTENTELLNHRAYLQTTIDQWHQDNPAGTTNEIYQAFLSSIGYLESPIAHFKLSNERLDSEISSTCGPQLVVPVDNARYAINAVNARWGNLYDAFYGSDLIADEGETAIGNGYNPARGLAVFQQAHTVLDTAIPLANATYADVTGFCIADQQLAVTTANGTTSLLNPTQWLGHQQNEDTLELVFINNGLHLILCINDQTTAGKQHPAHLSAVLLEAALTTILDLEDSVAVVDSEDKTKAYGNFFGLLKGDLETTFYKNNQPHSRTLVSDKAYQDLNGNACKLRARSLMLLRNVGLHMTTDMVEHNGKPAFEGLIDAVISGIFAKYSLDHTANSQQGSFYIVKPKMHGSKEVAFSANVFHHIEQALGLPKNTIKMGVMDEERRTSVNLKNCIAAADGRIFFINTGFLDRTGDEIHTSMQAGPMLPKADIKNQPWFNSYEALNVSAGLDSGFFQLAQIGKGMWALPDLMERMMSEKTGHLKAGANCAWVPSPTAATLHATHYHQINVHSIQQALAPLNQDKALEDLLTIPLLGDTALSQQTVDKELDNNIQGILGYVVHWVNAGVGCSKVPDINHAYLMEDRATLRISSQHVANWLHHGICSKRQVEESLQRMSKVVDQQNATNKDYVSLLDPQQPHAMDCAKMLIYEGCNQANGYTEFALTHYRKLVKKD